MGLNGLIEIDLEEESKSFPLWGIILISISIIAIVGGALFFFYKKYKKPSLDIDIDKNTKESHTPSQILHKNLMSYDQSTLLTPGNLNLTQSQDIESTRNW